MLVLPLLFFAQDNTPAATAASLASATSEPKPWWQAITVNGFASLSYNYNINQPYDRLNQFRVFDFNENEPQLDVAQLVVQRAVEKPKQFGFRFNMIAAPASPRSPRPMECFAT